MDNSKSLYTVPEEWKDVTGYERLYKVSNHGRLIALAKLVVSPQGFQYTRPEQKMSCYVSGVGYYQSALSNKDGKTKIWIHRLVALMFVDNPENKPCVNHKDGNKLNNYYENLEWVTVRENNIHARKIGLR